MNILNSIIMIFIMMGTGYIFARRGVLNDETNSVFGRLLINLCLPAAVLTAFMDRFTKQDLINSLFKLFVCYIIILAMYAAGLILIRIFKINVPRQSAVVNMIMFSNTLFIGLPVNTTLFGEEAAAYLFIYWFASFSTFWTLGIFNFTKGKEKFSILESLKKLITPPLIAFFIAITLIIIGLPLPEALYSPLKKFGSMTTPLGMLFLGTVIYNSDFKSFKFNRDVILVLAGRFVLAPILAIIIIEIAGVFIDMNALTKKVFVITASLPIMTNLAIIARQYKKDHEFSALMVGLSTILCIISIPLHAFLLELIY